MAQTKRLNETFHVGVVRMIRVFELPVEFWVVKVHVGDTWRVFNSRSIILTKLEFACRKLLELHDVLG